MSPDSYQLFNTWFPAIVVGLVISLFAAAVWDLLRRRTWCFASKLWPGILKEVGLDTSSPSRAEVEDKQQEIIEAISNLSPQINKALLQAKSSMAETIDSTLAKSSTCNCFVSSKLGATDDFDLEAQTGINPVYIIPGSSNSITFTATAYFPDDTPEDLIHQTKKLFKRYSKGTEKRWKSSIVLQASLPIDPCVLDEIVNLAKHCMHMEHRCTFQLDNWAILYCNAGEVHLHILKEGDVPVNVEARWQSDRTGITMRGLYLNGAQVKAATKRTNTILRSVGPAAQGPGELDELYFPIRERDVPGEDSLIFAAKIVKADGVSLIVRSEASFILPPREKFSFIEALWGQLKWISISARKMMKSFLTAEGRQAETTANRPEMRFDLEHSELILEHWKGVSKIELLENRKKVLHFLHKLRQFQIVNGASSQPPETHLHFIRDVEYWQRGLQDVNEVILQRLTGRLQSGTHIRIRGGMKFLCGDFASALQDLDLAYQIMREHPSPVVVERALVKCMLGRYSEALEDVGAVIAINPNENNIQDLQTCIQQILDQRTPIRRIPDDHEPRLSDQDNRMVTIPDLLTGDDWHSGEIQSPRTMSEDITDGGLIGDRSSMHAKSTGLAQPRDVAMAFNADTQRELEVGALEKQKRVVANSSTNSVSSHGRVIIPPMHQNHWSDMSFGSRTLTDLGDHLTPRKLFSGSANSQLAQEVARYMGLDLGNIKIKRFADGEIYVQLEESVRGCDVFLVQPTCPLANENLMELLIMIDACRRASAKTITAVIPYFSYASLADRKTQSRDSIATKFAANLINEAGANRVLACDLHSDKSMGYFDIPVNHVYGQPVILDYLASKMIPSDDLVVGVTTSFRKEGPHKYIIGSEIFDHHAITPTKQRLVSSNCKLLWDSNMFVNANDCRGLFIGEREVQFEPQWSQDQIVTGALYPELIQQPFCSCDKESGMPENQRVQTLAMANGRDGHCCRGVRTEPRTTQSTGSSRKSSTSQYDGVRFRPDLNKWVAVIRVTEWKSVDKKVWLGTFDTEQAAARSVDLARKLLKCKKKRHLNFPCEKLEAYSRQIPPHLILTDLAAPSMLKQVALFVKHECKDYAASFDWVPPTEQSGLERQTVSTVIQHSSPQQLLTKSSSINLRARGYENSKSPTNSSNVLDVVDHSKSDLILEAYTRKLEEFCFGTYTADEIDRARSDTRPGTKLPQPYTHDPDSPLIFPTKLQLQGIQFEELQPSCDDIVQVGDGQELKHTQVKDGIDSVTGKRKKSWNSEESPQVSNGRIRPGKRKKSWNSEESPQVSNGRQRLSVDYQTPSAKPGVE